MYQYKVVISNPTRDVLKFKKGNDSVSKAENFYRPLLLDSFPDFIDNNEITVFY